MEEPTNPVPRPPSSRRRRAPLGISVSERKLEPQELMLERDIAESEKRIKARLERGVFSRVSSEVQLKDPRLSCRWFNEEQNTHRIYQAQGDEWRPVFPWMVADLNSLGVYSVNESGHVVRGTRGVEHLMWQTKEIRALVKNQKTIENDRMLGSNTKAKAEMVETAAQSLGEEAAEFLEKNTFGEVTDGLERIEQRDPEAL